MNVYNKGKYLLRHAFEGTDYLPHDILFREKAAFSDAVGHSMVDYLKELAKDKYSDEDVLNAKDKYSYCTPFTKESLMYRDIFESFFPQQGKWIKDFWMPNKEWETVMLMIQVLVCLKTMEILENKNKAMLDVYSSIAFSSFILFSINIFSNSLKKNCDVL